MKRNPVKVSVYIILGVLYLFMASIFLRIVTKNILVEQLGISNRVTQFILSGMSTMDAVDEVTGELYNKVDWNSLYPFDNQTETATQAVSEQNSKIGQIYNQYTQKIVQIKNVVNDYCNEYLVGRVPFIEKAYSYEKLIQWSLIPANSNNGIIRKDDGYLTYVSGKIDTSDMANHLSDLNEFVKEKNIPLLYIQAPSKIDPDDADLPAGVSDYTNENIDQLLSQLDQNQVKYLDLRDYIKQNFAVYEDAFYKTDHHWKTTTAFGAVGELVKCLNSEFDFQIDDDFLQPDGYTIQTYAKYFLGSQGKKVTLAVAQPEDYQLVVPDFETRFSIQIPERNIDISGDFADTLLDYRHLQTIDYYNENCYASFMNRNDAYAQIINLGNGNIAEKKILFIKDSYSTPFIPYLAVGVRQIDTIYELLFTGSIQTYIEETRPDLVIVMYSSSSMSGNVESHSAFYNLQ